MNGLYIHDIDFERNKEYSGVEKKISAQIKGFYSQNADIDYVCLKNNVVYINGERTKKKISFYKFGRIKNIVMFIKSKEILKPYISEKKYDFAYIRFSMANFGMLFFVKFLYQNGIKVIIEIPTYPYNNELEINLKNKILIIFDKIMWSRIKKYLYCITVTNDIENLFGIKTVNMYNGVDLEKIPISKRVKNEKVVMTGVANINKWHGYDRIIEGLHEYYKNYSDVEVHFNIVGEGRAKHELELLVQKYKLDNYVHFLGSKVNTELDKVMDSTDIGVSSLALFRAGGGHDPIKTKEFIARGLPVLLGYNDKLVDMNAPFIFKTSETEEAVNIKMILEKYKKNKYTKYDIRKYAEENLSWDSQIKKVIDSII